MNSAVGQFCFCFCNKQLMFYQLQRKNVFYLNRQAAFLRLIVSKGLPDLAIFLVKKET